MLNHLILFIPFASAAVAFAIPWSKVRPFLLPIVGLAQMVLTLMVLWLPDSGNVAGWLGLDPISRIALLSFNALFFACTIYAPGYLRLHSERPNRIFVTCLLILQGAAQTVLFSRHLGLMWIAMEAMSLAAGPLIYFIRSPRSIEATWKYQLICSVGIAIALLGTFFMAFAGLQGSHSTSLLFDDMLKHATGFSRPWLRSAYLMLLVGYGTKMGLAPLHTWKPDAYGEAPGIVGALLAGGVTGCAFVAILRFSMIMKSAGESPYMQETLIGAGLLSMGFAAVFMLQQKDYKRMLAYSSVEHMGILILGMGIGGIAVYGSFLHLFNNAFTKGALFLSSGNIHRAYGSKSTDEVRGALRRLPVSGWVFLAGFLAISGSPPFGPFLSEFTILSGAFNARNYLVAGGMLLLLMTVFIGMGRAVLTVTQGMPSKAADSTDFRDTLPLVISPILLLGVVLLFGLHVPEPLDHLLTEAQAYYENPI